MQRWLAVLFVAGLLCAQDKFPLESLRVKGNERIPAEKILAVAGLKTGVSVVKADFDAARARLLATGAFGNVGYEYKPSASNKGYDATFDVVEIEQLFSYQFEDLAISDDKLRTELRAREQLFGEEIPGTVEVMSRFAKELEQIANTKVTGKLITDIPGHPMVVFRPNTPRANIAEVRFMGNEALLTSLLVNKLSEVAVGVPFTDATIRLLLESSIRPLYEARGRIRVAFTNITTEKSTTADGVIVSVTVNEGPSYTLGMVRFEGVAGADMAELQKTGNFRTGDVANFDDVKAGLSRIYAKYKDRGYLRAAGHFDREVHDKEHTVDLIVTLEPGAQFLMGKLDIVGLDIHSEPPIRKVWALKPGAPFTPGYPEGFLNSLREQGVFDNLGKTRADTQIDEKTKMVDVTLHFSGVGAKADVK